jgi:hypothetical protein
MGAKKRIVLSLFSAIILLAYFVTKTYGVVLRHLIPTMTLELQNCGETLDARAVQYHFLHHQASET